MAEILLLSLQWREIVKSSSEMRKSSNEFTKKFVFGFGIFLLIVPVSLDIIAYSVMDMLYANISKYVNHTQYWGYLDCPRLLFESIGLNSWSKLLHNVLSWVHVWSHGKETHRLMVICCNRLILVVTAFGLIISGLFYQNKLTKLLAKTIKAGSKSAGDNAKREAIKSIRNNVLTIFFAVSSVC